MNRRTLTTLTVLSLSAAGAQTVDCATVQLPLIDTLLYTVPDTFPNPSKRELKFLGSETVQFSACGMTITSDTKGNYAVTTGGAQKLQALFTGSDGTALFPAIFASRDTYKNLATKEGPYSQKAWLAFDFKTRLLSSIVSTPEELEGLQLVSAGYTFDGGPLTPFFYEGKIQPVTVPTGTRVVDVYVLRRGVSGGFDRLQLNLAAGAYRVWQTHPFPAR